MIIIKFYKMILRLRCNLGFSCVSNHDILHFAITSVKVLGGVLAGGDPSPPPPLYETLIAQNYFPMVCLDTSTEKCLHLKSQS